VNRFPAIAAALTCLAACAPKNEYVAPPPPTVTVATPETRDVVDYLELPGSTAPHKVVEIRARVKGFLAEILYQPGALVEKDTVLFRIDPAEYEASVRSAEADLASAKADLASAEAGVKSAEARVALAETAVQKLEKAYESRAVSEIQVLEVQAKRDVSRAELDHARAQCDVAHAYIAVVESRLERARLELGYTTLRAPMRGYVAMWNKDVGALVGAGDPTLLTTIINDEKVFCSFDVAEGEALALRRAQEEKGGPRNRNDVTIGLALTGEEGFPHTGHPDYVEPTVNPETGTLRVRAVFDNPDRAIPPGTFARVRIPIAERKGALLVTERAVSVDQNGSFLLVVNAEGTVERHDVELGGRHGPMVHVVKGVNSGDRVIVSGLQRARAGAKVNAEPAKNS